MKILVQKFGGTSVAAPEARQRACKHVMAATRQGLSPVVVVSAMGRQGDPYATDTLISLIKNEFPNPDAREMDLLMNCGEIISIVIMAHALRAEGIDAVALTGGQAGVITDARFGHARIRSVQTATLLETLRQGRVPVVAGFQGTTEKGDVTTIGRGGSDVTAVALGAALEAEATEIYTDVDGVRTADPRLVPGARAIRQMTYEEALQMTRQGAKVVHPRAVEIAMRFHLPIKVRSTFDDSPGTLVCSGKAHEAVRAFWFPRQVTGLTHLTGLATVCVPSCSTLPHLLAESGIPRYVTLSGPMTCSLVIKSELLAQVSTMLEEKGHEVSVITDCALISLVGPEICELSDAIARMFSALAQQGIDVVLSWDSASVVSCVVRRADLERALGILHTGLVLPELGGDEVKASPGELVATPASV